MKYPNVKNFILLLIAALIIIGALLISRYENSITKTRESGYTDNKNILALATTTMQNSPITYQGNWEKALSSVFGTSSGWTNPASLSSGSAKNNLTPTDIFSQDLFSKYAEYQQAGADFNDPNTQQQIVGQVMSDGTYIPSPKVYARNDLKISTDNSNAALVEYGNDVGNIFKFGITVHEYELNIVQESLDSKDPTILKQLDPIVTEYQNILNALLALRVPSTVGDLHLSLVNAMSELLFADQNLTKIYSDGITSLAGLSQYQKGVNDLAAALLGIGEYFSVAKITFNPNDGGAMFTPKTN